MKMNFFSNKRGTEMTLSIIVIAAIALIVLVVMIFIFSGKIKAFGSGVDSCASKGGACAGAYTQGCIESGSCKCPSAGDISISGTDCEKKAQICCKPIL